MKSFFQYVFLSVLVSDPSAHGSLYGLILGLGISSDDTNLFHLAASMSAVTLIKADAYDAAYPMEMSDQMHDVKRMTMIIALWFVDVISVPARSEQQRLNTTIEREDTVPHRKVPAVTSQRLSVPGFLPQMGKILLMKLDI